MNRRTEPRGVSTPDAPLAQIAHPSRINGSVAPFSVCDGPHMGPEPGSKEPPWTESRPGRTGPGAAARRFPAGVTAGKNLT